MSGMDQFLASYYGTAGATQTTETDKTAAAEQEAAFELFAKVAAAEGIDLASMSDEDVMALYTKVASEDEPKEEEEKKEEEKKEKEKEATAKAELAAKTAAAATATPEVEAKEKIAEADFLGRVMAHAYVHEMKKIAAEGGGTPEVEPTEEEKAASQFGALKAHLTGKGTHIGAHHAVEKGKEMAGKAVGGAKRLATSAKEHASGMHKEVEGARKAHAHGGSEETAERLRRAHAAAQSKGGKHIGIGAAGAAGAAGAGLAAHQFTKKSSALDELAAEKAMAKIAEAGWDIDQGAELLTQLLLTGASEESSKIASANGDLDGALEIRSLELLEQCGYTVNWS